MPIEFPHDFEPREYQRPFMRHFIGTKQAPLDGSGRKAVWVVHRRGGKDLTGMHMLNICAHRRKAAYWHTFPTFEQGRKAIWEGFTKDGKRIVDNVFPAEIVKRRDNQSMVIELKCGSIYRVLGTDKIDLVGAGVAGVLHSEYSIAKPSAADLIAPMLRENNGWEAYVYTPRGNNHGRKRFDSFTKQAKVDPRYFAELLTLYDTQAYDPDKTFAEERANGRPEALIRQEYLCDWTAANVGSVWGDLLETLEKNGGVAEFDHANDGMFTTWDLGHTDSTAIWFWRVNSKRSVDLVDHYEAHGRPMSHYFDVVESKPYRYVKHWLPHDARAKSLESGSSIVEQSLARWPDIVDIAPQLSIADGIQAGRWLLQRPMRIHPRCGEGIEALRLYHYSYDEDRKSFSTKPEHDWSSHTADAFRYLALVVKESELLTRKPVAPTEPPRGPERATLDELWLESDRDWDRRHRG